MNIKRRTQAERTAATRDALIAAGRALFGARGYADVGTEEIVRTAGVSRGALYHQFTDKAELFAAVFASVEEITSARITAAATAAAPDDPIAAMRLGTAAFMDICTEPEMARIMLIDAPAVLGEQRWTDISTDYNMGLVLQLISRGIELGRIPAQPPVPLARILLGAIREGALYLAGADDPAIARAQVGAVLNAVIESVARPASAVLPASVSAVSAGPGQLPAAGRAAPGQRWPRRNRTACLISLGGSRRWPPGLTCRVLDRVPSRSKRASPSSLGNSRSSHCSRNRTGICTCLAARAKAAVPSLARWPNRPKTAAVILGSAAASGMPNFVPIETPK